MRKNKPTRGMHIVPKVHLREFAHEEKVLNWDLSRGREFPISIRRCTRRNDIYTIPDHSDGPDVFESLMSRDEGEYSAIVPKLEVGYHLTQEDRVILARFAALQILRGSAFRKVVEKEEDYQFRLRIGRLNGSKMSEFVQSEGISEMNPPRLQQELLRGEHTLLVGSQVFVESIVAEMNFVPEYLLNCAWTFYKFLSPSLFTSDQPINLSLRNVEQRELFSMPLSRTLGLVFHPPEPNGSEPDIVADQYRDGTPEVAEKINLATLTFAQEIVIYHPKDKDILMRCMETARAQGIPTK